MTKNEGKKREKRMLTRNDKITSNNRGVQKPHCKHQGCYVGHENFLFPTIKSIDMFRVECIGYNVDWPVKSSHFFFVLLLLEGCGAAGRGRRGFKFLGFWCLFHVPIMFCKVTKVITQPVPDSTTLFIP